MKKRRIAIDCDDVIISSSPAIIAHYNKTYGTTLELSDTYSNDLERWDVPDEATAIKRVDAYLDSDDFLAKKPFQEAVEIIRQLNNYHELHIVTGRPDRLSEPTRHMLQEHFPDIFQSVEFTNFITVEGKSRPKSQVCQELGVDLLIDDHLHHAELVAQCGIEVLLFGNYPWNQAKNLPNSITRVKDWKEVAHYLIP